MTVLLPAALLLSLAETPGAPPDRGEYDASPSSPIPPGWSELDLRIDTPGAGVVVDTAQLCGLPCRMLLAPGEHAFRLMAPDLDARDYTRTFEEGSSLLLEGGLVEESRDGWGIALYVIGAAALLTATALVAADVALNVGYAQGDWTKSYAAAGLGPIGLALSIWGAVRGGDVEAIEPSESVGR
ncbi:MAG: hypothetical protein HY905_26085 [Deltaproteobacteria bacterium]|nr:hypothetical protein [Deltaproteobacteria bacterium]